MRRSAGGAKLSGIGVVLFIIGFLLLVGVICWLARGKPNDHNSTNGTGGTGYWNS